MPEKKTALASKRCVAIQKTDILKYPNRCLYDQIESRYITQRDVLEKLRKGTVRVVERKTGFDITARTIVAIVMELEEAGEIQLNTVDMRALLLRLTSPLKAAA